MEKRTAKSAKYKINAGASLYFGQSGDFIKIISSTGRLTLEFQNGDKIPVYTGVSYKTTETMTEGFRIYNETINNIEFEIVWGYGELKDESLKVLDGIIEKPYTDAMAENSEISVSGSLDLVVPAGYRHLLLQNTGANDIRIGGTGGYKIAPNGVFNLEFQGTLTLIGTSTIAVTFLK